MRTFLIAFLFLGSAICIAVGRLTPLSAKDIGLMLRTGYSAESVQRELSARHFVPALSAADETVLLQAGATRPLLDSLKSGAFDVSASDASAAQAEVAAQTERRAAQAAEAQKINTLYQNQIAKARAGAPISAPSAHPVAAALKGDLVSWKNGSIAHFDDEGMPKKKFIALYFSAHWCVPCRKFTPQLVEWYNRVASQHPEFEIVFVSSDRSLFAMETYMREAQMPWPAVEFAKLESKAELKKLGGDGIPSLIAIDASGRMLSSSYNGQQYVGPAKVVADLEAIFAQPPNAKVAQSR
ncbi:MAG: thioredoxin-like domain-containing protein [Chthoniobacterales bacterium]